MDAKSTIQFERFDRTPRLAELKVAYRRRQVRRGKAPNSPFVIVDSKSCETYLRQIWNRDTIELREEFIVLCLNSSNAVMGWVNVASGGISATTVDPRIIFGVALQTASASIIVAHNHPSGSITPSRQDTVITQRLRTAGEMLSITLHDHLILTSDGYYSFADMGWTG